MNCVLFLLLGQAILVRKEGPPELDGPVEEEIQSANAPTEEEVARELTENLKDVCAANPTACAPAEPAEAHHDRPNLDGAWCDAQWPGVVQGSARAQADGAVSELDESALDYLSLVSVMPAAAIQPDGKVLVRSFSLKGMATDAYRPGVYFAVSTIVPDELLGAISDTASGEDGGVVASRGIAVVVPYRKVEARLLNLWPFDTVVLGDLDLAELGATLLYPEGHAPELNPGVNVRLLPYGSKGKRAAVDCLLVREGRAVLQSYTKVAPMRWGVLYGLPNGQRLQLGAGPDADADGTELGGRTAQFLDQKYDGKVSFGPEVSLVLKNNATEALLPLSLLTSSMCAYEKKAWHAWVPGIRYLDRRAILPLWRGWKVIGDYFMEMIERRVKGFEYGAHADQVESWKSCRSRFSSEMSEWDSPAMQDSVSSKAHGALDKVAEMSWLGTKLQNFTTGYEKVVNVLQLSLAQVMMPNMVQVFVDPKALPELYGFYKQPCADSVRAVLTKAALRAEAAFAGGPRQSVAANVNLLKGECKLNQWVADAQAMLANVARTYENLQVLIENENEASAYEASADEA